MNYLINALANYYQGFGKCQKERRTRFFAFTPPSSEDPKTFYANEGLYPSEAIKSTAYGPRKIVHNVYYFSMPDICTLYFPHQEGVVTIPVTTNMQDCSKQYGFNRTE